MVLEVVGVVLMEDWATDTVVDAGVTSEEVDPGVSSIG